MKFNPGSGVFEIRQFNDRGHLLIANDSSGLGTDLIIRGQARSHNDYINFGIGAEDADELAEILPGLADSVPKIESIIAEHDEEQVRRERKFGIPPQPLVVKAPLVGAIEQVGDVEFAFMISELLAGEESIAVGGLKWARDQLIFRFEDIDTFIFRPEATRQLAEVAGNQPDFAPRKSIWG